MLVVDNKEYRNIQQQVAENTDDIADLQNKHIYEHLIFITGKLKDAGVTKDDYTFACRFRILNNSSTALTTNTLASTINTNYIPANGYVHYTTNESQYTIFSIQTNTLDRSVLVISTIPTEYTPAGQGSSVVGELTNIIDKVNMLI